MKFSAQTIVLIIFGAGILIATAAFSGLINLSSPDAGSAESISGRLEIWGTLDKSLMGSVTRSLRDQYENVRIDYVEIPADEFDDTLVQALAADEGPDLFFLPDEKVLQHKNKAFIIPFESYAPALYEQKFIDGAEIFLDPEGVIAFPFLIDPMVMYYNRDMLTSSFVLDPPATWTDMLTFAPELTAQTDSGELLQSAVALGTLSNMRHGKDVLTLIMLQANNPIVEYNQLGTLTSTLLRGGSGASAVRYFTIFSNPAQEAYSWNPGQIEDRQAFLAGDLALYFGYASEIESLRRENPNLNFNVTLMPQLENATVKRTFAQMEGLAISKGTPNLNTAITIANALTAPAVGEVITESLNLPPVQKDLLRQKPQESYLVTFYNSALIGSNWLDPNESATQNIFNRLVQDTVSGLLQIEEAILQAHSALEQLL